jgi:hypothetical protein
MCPKITREYMPRGKMDTLKTQISYLKYFSEDIPGLGMCFKVVALIATFLLIQRHIKNAMFRTWSVIAKSHTELTERQP